ncbi:MAG: hypothetical protein JJ992_09560 [Planctomycetes bacterium]|jgi:hypothetical protein|nr:hypothetical protein [Planctomycetota bacterium]
MARRDRLMVLVVLLLISTFVFADVASAQDEPVADDSAAYHFSFGLADIFEVAASFDVKFLEPDYIAYSGADATAQQALAIRAAASFDLRFFTPGSLAYQAPEELFAHEACFDTRYFMPGHITCPGSG